MNVLRFLIRLSVVLSLGVSALLAQVNRNGDAVPAGEGALWNVGIGYSYMNMNLSGKPSVHLNGIESSATIDFLPRWGATLDSSYVRAGRDPGSGHSSYVLSALAGPVFVPIQNHNTRLLVRALGGVSLVDSSVRVNDTDLYYRGWMSRFSMAIGTGIERTLPTMPFGVRFNVDYIRTRFMGPTAVVQPQNGIRWGVNFVFRLGIRQSHLVTNSEP